MAQKKPFVRDAQAQGWNNSFHALLWVWESQQASPQEREHAEAAAILVDQVPARWIISFSCSPRFHIFCLEIPEDLGARPLPLLAR